MMSSVEDITVLIMITLGASGDTEEKHQVVQCTVKIKKSFQLTSSLLVKAGKSITDHILRISAVQLLSKHGQKHGKVDWSGRFVHHRLQVILCGVLTCETVSVMRIYDSDTSTLMSSTHIEGILALHKQMLAFFST